MGAELELAGSRGTRLAAILAWAVQDRREDGMPNFDRAGELFGVSASAVRRWVRDGLPASRVEFLEPIIALPRGVLEMQRRQADEARERVAQLRYTKMLPQQAWVEQSWLDPHVLQIVVLTGKRHLCGVRISAVSAGSNGSAWRSGRYGAQLLDEVVFPNRFVAQVAKYEVLEAVGQWRVRVPAGYVEKGGTEMWLFGAPVPSLARLKRSLAARKIAKHRKLAGADYVQQRKRRH